MTRGPIRTPTLLARTVLRPGRGSREVIPPGLRDSSGRRRPGPSADLARLRHAQVHSVWLEADPHERVGRQNLENVERQLNGAVLPDNGELFAVVTLGAHPTVTDRDGPSGWPRQPLGRG